MQATDKKYFIDPISKAADDGPQILVIDVYNVARSGKYLDTIENIRVEGMDTQGATTEGRYWHTSREGYFLAGPVLNIPGLERRTEVIGWTENSDFFMYGRLGHTTGSAMGRMIHNVVRSDRQGVGLHNLDWAHATHYARAASWAAELMPARGDSSEMVEAKLQKARSLWEDRRTMVEIVRQGHNRGWTTDLEGLRTDGFPIPDPVFSHTVTAEVLVGTGNVSPAFLNAGARDTLASINGGTPPTSVTTRVGIYATVSVDNVPDGRDLTQQEVQNAVSRRFRDHYGLTVGSYSSDRIVTDVTPHVDPVPATA